jgi:hypothetical protein
MPRRLIGSWFGKVANEPVSLEFTEDGHLAYMALSGGRRKITLLTYRIEDGDVLVTDRPSRPRVERTMFRLDESGRLVLAFGGVETSFER